MCASCHTLITTAGRTGRQPIARFPSRCPTRNGCTASYRDQRRCRAAHAQVKEEAPHRACIGGESTGVERHEFGRAISSSKRCWPATTTIFQVNALPRESNVADGAHVEVFLQNPRRSCLGRGGTKMRSGRLEANVTVENLGGHKLPTDISPRRAWLHGSCVIAIFAGQSYQISECTPDGSSRANGQDADPLRFEPHYHDFFFFFWGPQRRSGAEL